MNQPHVITDGDFYQKLKWLMFCRILFTSLLLGSTIILHLGEDSDALAKPLAILYGLIIWIFVLSVCYRIMLYRVRRKELLAYTQIGMDTVIVTLIIFMTGSYSSLFSFLYLVVIIYASMLLFRKGSMIMAAVCGIQYGIMVDLEYYGILKPFGMNDSVAAMHYEWGTVFYKVLIIIVACFAIAFLSSLLSEQERASKRQLAAMEKHVKRVQKMAAVGEMAAGLAHEIKNPIASLRGSIQMLREEVDYDPDHDRLMRIVLREADRLSTLVTDFLLFAKPPAGRTEPIDLSRALEEVVDLFKQDNKCSQCISIEKDITPDIWVEMDPSHLRQIFWNLLLNAVDAIEEEGRIDVNMHPIKEQYVVIKIADNGQGMPEECIQSIFDPFFTTKASGSGLGLSIVHRIIEAYDCWLDVESAVGKGTQFSLNLKQIDQPDPEQNSKLQNANNK